MRVLWVNDDADFTGGCEQYIHQTVALLNEAGIRSILLYRVGRPISQAFTQVFEGVYPMVELRSQLPNLAADIVYVHRLECMDTLKLLTEIETPVIRFFHDHKLFCLREHKYTTIRHQTCSRKVGLHCYTCLGFISRQSGSLGLRSLSALEKQIEVNKALDGFVVGSSYMAEHLQLHGFAEEKIVTAPLFCKQTAGPDEIPSVSMDEIEPALKKSYLLFVGQLIRGKGIDTLIEAMAQVDSDIDLVICGSGRMAADYRSQTARLGVAERVQFLGRRNAAELELLYRNARLVVIPARAPETFCLVGLEALRQGTPVIASNVGGMRDWFKPSQNGWSFAANDVGGLARVIDEALSDEVAMRRVREFVASDNYDRFKPENHVHILKQTFGSMVEVS